MADTFSQIYIQIVFAVKGRDALINESWELNLHQYISGIIANKKQKLYAINGTSDHIHFLISISPSCCISDLVREIKKSSTNYIMDKQLSKLRFQWQEGYGAFSYSYSEIPNVISYINNQKEHHRKITFKDEYKKFLNDANIEFKDEYLFVWN